MKETDFKAFDQSELAQYAKEVSERWGATAAYAAYQQKAKGRTDKEQEEIGSRLMLLFAELGKNSSPVRPKSRRCRKNCCNSAVYHGQLL